MLTLRRVGYDKKTQASIDDRNNTKLKVMRVRILSSQKNFKLSFYGKGF